VPRSADRPCVGVGAAARRRTPEARGSRLRAGRRARSGGAREFLEPRVGFACADLAEVDEEDRASLVQLVHRAVDGVVVDCGAAQEPPGSAKAGDPRAFGVAFVGDDEDAVGVGERALSLLVGVAGEAAGALATLEYSAAVGADGRVGRDRSGEPTDRLVADVAVVRCPRADGCRVRARRWRAVPGPRSVAYVLVSVVMEMSSVVSPAAWLAARIMRSGGCGAFAER
jgi:hypothetical protein